MGWAVEWELEMKEEMPFSWESEGLGGLLSGVYSVEDVVSGVDPSFGGVGGKLKELEVGGCTERGAVGLWCFVLYGLILGHPEWA